MVEGVSGLHRALLVEHRFAHFYLLASGFRIHFYYFVLCGSTVEKGRGGVMVFRKSIHTKTKRVLGTS